MPKPNNHLKMMNVPIKDFPSLDVGKNLVLHHRKKKIFSVPPTLSWGTIYISYLNKEEEDGQHFGIWNSQLKYKLNVSNLANLATFFKLDQSSEKVALILFYIQECKFVSDEFKKNIPRAHLS